MSTNVGRVVWWPMHLACWFPLTFAGPFFVVLGNPEDVVVSAPVAAVALAVLCLSLTGLSTVLAGRLGPAWRRRAAIVLLAMGLVMALQGNVVHEMFYYGEFDGNAVDWRRYGVAFWLELAGFCLALGLIPAVLLRLRQVPWPIQWLPVASCGLLLIPAIFSYLEKPAAAATRNFDPSVFEFSAERNLIHLLPDGLQGDLVRQVLDRDPGLARAFAGFTLFTDHLGMYQGTAPSVPVLLTGRSLALRRGYTVAGIREFVREHAYPNRLTAAGYRLDYVGGHRPAVESARQRPPLWPTATADPLVRPLAANRAADSAGPDRGR